MAQFWFGVNLKFRVRIPFEQEAIVIDLTVRDWKNYLHIFFVLFIDISKRWLPEYMT